MVGNFGMGKRKNVDIEGQYTKNKIKLVSPKISRWDARQRGIR